MANGYSDYFDVDGWPFRCISDVGFERYAGNGQFEPYDDPTDVIQNGYVLTEKEFAALIEAIDKDDSLIKK